MQRYLKKFSLWLRKSAEKRSLSKSKMIHSQLVISGLEPDTHLWASMVNAYVKCGSTGYALKVFDKMTVRDIVSWNALISGYLEHGQPDNGLYLFVRMQREGLVLNEFALATGLKACSMCLELDLGKLVHAQVIKLGFCLDLFIGSSLVDLYAKCGLMELAYGVFCSMPVKSVMVWNALLNGYAEEGDGRKLIYMFHKIKDMETKFNNFILATVLKGFASSGDIKAGEAVHSLVVKLGYVLDGIVTLTLLDMYTKCGCAEETIKVFNSIQDPNVVAWNKVLICLEQQGRGREAANWFTLMRCTNVKPNEFTFASLICVGGDLRDLRYGESVQACVCKYGFESETLISNALLSMYMQNGCPFQGLRMFEKITDKDSVSWNALLSGLQDHQTCGWAPRIFKEMLVRGFQPNNITFNSVLRCGSSLFDVAFGRQIHVHIIKNRLHYSNFIGTALIDMYAKCGCLNDADVAFNRLIKRNLFAWTTMISSYAQADQANETLTCFIKMQQEGVKPNEFTLASCLSGCSDITTFETGQSLHSMSIKSGLSLDRYVSTALVHMYGKCGYTADAETIFKELVVRDTVSWNAMINIYVESGKERLALEAFKMMLDEKISPDEVSLRIIRYAYNNLCMSNEVEHHHHSLLNELIQQNIR